MEKKHIKGLETVSKVITVDEGTYFINAQIYVKEILEASKNYTKVYEQLIKICKMTETEIDLLLKVLEKYSILKALFEKEEKAQREKLLTHIKQWFSCPICSQRLCKVDNTAKGVFLQCKRCKQEIEVKSRE